MFRLVLVFVALGAAALADAQQQQPQQKPNKADKPKLDPDLEEILKLTNEARAKQKLPLLTIDPTLTQVAADYSKLMAEKKKMAHRLDGKSIGQRIFAAGYDYKTAAENVANAVGKKNDPPPKPADLVKSWMESSEHQKNIMNGKHVVIGLGVARCSDGDYYYTQVFASPRKK